MTPSTGLVKLVQKKSTNDLVCEILRCKEGQWVGRQLSVLEHHTEVEILSFFIVLKAFTDAENCICCDLTS